MQTLLALSGYLEKVLGHAPELSPVTEQKLALLPLYLRTSYRYVSARLAGRPLIFAVVNELASTIPSSTRASHLGVIEGALGAPVALVLPGVPSYERNRLVHQQVPFVVPGSQMFLPTLGMDLREHFQRIAPAAGRGVTPSTQVLLLHYLLGNSVREYTLQQLADQLGYSAMTMSNASRQLVDHELAETDRAGRSVRLAFRKSRQRTWIKALKYLKSPVRRTVQVDRPSGPPPGLRAGTSALAALTSLEAGPVATFAVAASQWRMTRQRASLPDQGRIQLQLWDCDPKRLSGDASVDPLSLYLSLRDSGDERIQVALEKLLEAFNW